MPWKSLSLHCVLSEPWNMLLSYGKIMRHVLGVSFPAMMIDLYCRSTFSHPVSFVASGVHLQDDGMRLHIQLMNRGRKPSGTQGQFNLWLIFTTQRPKAPIAHRLKQNQQGNKGLIYSSALFCTLAKWSLMLSESSGKTFSTDKWLLVVKSVLRHLCECVIPS